MTVEQADKLRRVQSRPKGAVARMGSAKEKKGAVVGRGGQSKVLALAIRSRVAATGTAGRRVTGWPTAQPSGSRGPQEDGNRPLLSLMVGPLGSSPLSSKVLSKERAQHPTRVERVHSRVRVPLRPRAPFSRAMGNRRVWTSVPPCCHRCHLCLLRDDTLRRQGRPFQRGVPYKLIRLPGFGLKVGC